MTLTLKKIGRRGEDRNAKGSRQGGHERNVLLLRSLLCEAFLLLPGIPLCATREIKHAGAIRVHIAHGALLVQAVQSEQGLQQGGGLKGLGGLISASKGAKRTSLSGVFFKLFAFAAAAVKAALSAMRSRCLPGDALKFKKRHFDN